MKIHLFFATSLMLLLANQKCAFAHAFLDHADPRVGSEIATAPVEVKVWFTQDLEPAFSSLQVFDANGTEVDKKDSHPDSKDKTLLIISVPPLQAGTYKIVWKVVSVDTHHTAGDFKFTIKPKE